MNVPSLLFGLLLLGAVVVDLLWTTLWIGGGSGPLTTRLSRGTWRSFRRATSKDSTLSLAGPVILVLTLLVWLGLLWAGWTFVFLAGEPSLLSTRTYAPAAWPDQGYFVAYSMFTMGNGDFTPAGGGWQVATSLTTGSGMLLVTLSITYVLSVLRAVTQARSFASGVTGLGRVGGEIVRRGWDPEREDFDDLDFQLTRLASQLDDVTEQHLSYPILHYYHSIRQRSATPRAVALLADVLLLLESGVADGHRADDVVRGSLASSIDSYLEVLESEAIDPAEELPPHPDLEDLRERDIPTVTDEAFDAGIDGHRSRRQLLNRALEQTGRRWPSEGP